MMVAPVVVDLDGLARGWRESVGERGRHLRNFSLFREPPAIARQDAEGDAAAALVIGFAGWEKNPRHSLEDGTEPAVQFMARAPTGLEGAGRMAPSRHAHARENYFAVRPNFSWQLDRRGSPRLAPSPLALQQLELMFERDGLARSHLSSRHS